MSWKKQARKTAPVSSLGHLWTKTIPCAHLDYHIFKLRYDPSRDTRNSPEISRAWRMSMESVSQSWTSKYSYLKFCPRTHPWQRLTSRWLPSPISPFTAILLPLYKRKRCLSSSGIFPCCVAWECRTRRHGNNWCPEPVDATVHYNHLTHLTKK